MATSQVRQNYHAESEEGVNKQINMELYAMYTYLSMVINCCFSMSTTLVHYCFVHVWRKFLFDFFRVSFLSLTTLTGMT